MLIKKRKKKKGDHGLLCVHEGESEGHSEISNALLNLAADCWT